MILGYRNTIGGGDAYHFAKINGADRKFIRVMVGAALPIFDRIAGAAIVVAENYRASGPASWVTLVATCGSWLSVENAMAQWRRDLKFTHVVVDSEPARDVVRRMKGMNYGLSDIPLTTYEAPHYFDTEIGRSYVDSLLSEGRLVLPDHVRREMEMERDMAKSALQAVLCWAKDYAAYYAPLREPEHRSGRVLGVEGL